MWGKTHSFASKRSVIDPFAFLLPAAYPPEELWQLPQQPDQDQTSRCNHGIAHACIAIH